MKRGSALIMALWIIAVLSVMVLSFATEAHLQTGVNVYVRERNRVNRLVDAGRMIGEVILLGYSDAKEWSEDEDTAQLFEDDRWYREKRDLKNDSKCTIGPILLDEEHPESGTVTIEISLSESYGININQLYNGGDKNYVLRWQMILRNAGIDEELDVEAKESDGSTRRRNLMNHLIACWNDWRDEDDTVSAGPITEENSQSDDGAEKAWYEEADETAERELSGRASREEAQEERRRPRNGSIPDIKELSYVRGFRDFPAVLTGGLLYPEEDESEDNPRVTGIVDLFGTTGSSKVNVNNCTVQQLLTVPGICAEDEDDADDAQSLAQAIVDGLTVKPEDRDVDESRTWWPYKDMQDLSTRLEDNLTDSSIKLGEEASQYLAFNADDKTLFKMQITGESSGMRHTVSCLCYVKDKKVRYIEWTEDPDSDRAAGAAPTSTSTSTSSSTSTSK